MTLLYPALLWLLVPLSILWYYRPKKLTDTLHLIILLLIVVSLSRPVVKGGREKGEIESRDIIIALDASYSMRAKDVIPDRYRYATESIDELLSANHTDNIMLIAFTSNPLLLSPPTTDHALISLAMKSLKRDNILTRGTSLEKLFSKVSQLPMQKKILVLFTDGGEKIEISSLADTLRENTISLIVLALGTSSGSTIEKEDGTLLKDSEGNLLVSRVNPQLERLANESGGRYIAAPQTPQRAAEALQSEIDAISIEYHTISKMQHNNIELFQIPLMVAAILFLILHTRAVRFLLPLAALWGSSANASVLDGYILHQAYSYYDKGEINATIQALERIDNPSLESQVAKAAAYYRQGRYRKSLILYRSIRSTSPQIKQMLNYNIGNCYANLKRYNKAIEYYSKSLQLGDDSDAEYNLKIVTLKKSESANMLQSSHAKAQGESAAPKEASEAEDSDEGKKEEQNSGGGSGSGGENKIKQRKDNKKKKIMLLPSKEKLQEQPLSSKVYDLINKGYINEKEPW